MSKAKQAGQAVVEYILVLFITVAIVLGVLYQFNDAFKNFLDSYFGDYIACLLETGELPSLGGEGPTQSQCRAPLQDFSLSNGKALSAGGSGGGGGSSRSSDGGSSGDNASGSGDNSTRPGSRNRPSRVSSRGGGGNGEATNRGASSGRVASIRKSKGNRINNNPTGKEATEGAGSESSGAGLGGRRGKTRKRKRVIYLGDDYTTEDAKRKKKSAVVASGKKSDKEKGEEALRRPSFKLEVPEAKVTRDDEAGQGFSFGFFIKFLLIAGIIIAIFIFLGGQAVQIKKSWQKSD